MHKHNNSIKQIIRNLALGAILTLGAAAFTPCLAASATGATTLAVQVKPEATMSIQPAAGTQVDGNYWLRVEIVIRLDGDATASLRLMSGEAFVAEPCGTGTHGFEGNSASAFTISKSGRYCLSLAIQTPDSSAMNAITMVLQSSDQTINMAQRQQ
jgi:hypothetical protein